MWLIICIHNSSLNYTKVNTYIFFCLIVSKKWPLPTLNTRILSGVINILVLEKYGDYFFGF